MASGTKLPKSPGRRGTRTTSGTTTPVARIAPLFVARFDLNWMLTFSTAGFAGLFGATPAALAGQNALDIVGSRVFKALSDALARAAKSPSLEDSLSFSLDLPARVIEASVASELAADGQVCGIVVAMADVTERKGIEAGLRQRKRQFQTLVDNSPDVIARLDTELRHVYVNRAAEDAFAALPDEWTGKGPLAVRLPADVGAAYENAASAALAAGLEQAFSFSLRQGTHIRHFTVRVLPEFDDDGKVESLLAIFYDLTHRTEAQLERDALLIAEKSARMQAEAAARARDQFLAVVSHELRSPLNGIQSWTHVLEVYLDKDALPMQRALTGIKTGVQQQVELIDDLLDATQVLSGKLRLTKSPADLRDPVMAAVARFSGAASDKSVALSARYPDEVVQIDADAARVEQIVVNILANAIKFTPEGGQVELTLTTSDLEATITVRDTGSGVSAEFLPDLFDPFRQADGSNTRRVGGMGLGLTMVRRLTELHGGRVEAHSDGVGQGSTFTIHLPLTQEPLAPLAADLAIKANSMRVLRSLTGKKVVLVDDHRESRDALAELLRHAGAVVETHDSGIDAEQYLERLSETDQPDVFICDIAMPEQDGYTTLGHIRAHEKSACRSAVPAIAITAFAQREDKLRALASGFQVHMAKPVDPADLISVIDTLAQKDAAAINSAIQG